MITRRLRPSAPRSSIVALLTVLALGLMLLTASRSLFAQESPASLLARARAEAAAQRVDRAVELYRASLTSTPNDTIALREVIALLAGRGRWSDAVSFAEQLVAHVPTDAAAQFQAGQWLSWRGRREEGVTHLRRAAQLAPDSVSYRLMLGQVLSWASDGRVEGMRTLRELVASHPNDVAAVRALAQVLSWDARTRQESIPLYERVLAAAPADSAVLGELADVLSWNAQTRDRASALYARLLREHPSSARGLRGRLNLLTWSGQIAQSSAIYDSLLAASPSEPAWLRGKAGVLLMGGNADGARALARRALALAPADTESVLVLARAELALGRPEVAEAILAPYADADEARFRDLRGALQQAQATIVDVDASTIRTSLQLSIDRLNVAVSTPALGGRLGFRVRPSRFSSATGGFSSAYLALTAERSLSARARVSAEVGYEQYPSAPDAVDGAVTLQYRPASGVEIGASARRSSVEDSRRSAQGVVFAGELRGQVRANLLSVDVSTIRLPLGLDARARASVGEYVGRNVESNARTEYDVQLGRVLRQSEPRVRIGVGASRLTFDYDANLPPVVTRPERSGGYWSPSKFNNLYATLGGSYRFGQRVQASVDAGVGRNPGTASLNAVSDAPGFTTISSNVTWRASSTLELTASHFYLDTSSIFRMGQLRLGARRWF